MSFYENIMFTFLSLFLICQIFIGVDTQVTYVGKGCVRSDNGTDFAYLEPTNYLTGLLNNLTTESQFKKFYRVEVGDNFSTIYGLFQCREDLTDGNCRRCVGEAAEFITGVCPSYVEAIVWYQECTLRYSNRSINTTYETFPIFKNTSNAVSGYVEFPKLLVDAMDSLINYTAYSSPSHIAGSINILPSTEKLYCFAQCTPDIGNLGCDSCLRTAFSQVTNCCGASVQGMVFLPSCQLRYNNSLFWLENMPLAPPLNQVLDTNPRWKAKIIATTVCATLIGLVVVVCRWLYRKHQNSSGHIVLGVPATSQNGLMDDIVSLEPLRFDFKSIKASTCNFSNNNKLGKGGFGEVFKGSLPEGRDIAVKRLLKRTEQSSFEFKNEVLIVANLQHKNLVKLLGFCLSTKEQILIYEFLSNSSLDRFLYDPLKRESLEWATRFKILNGVAKGLSYLHEDSRLKIIHRDLKASNILLDEAMNAKIADFGLAKLFDFDQTQGNTMRIAGTYGYMAPEYAIAGHFSAKSDVYSFGVLVLEIVSGQKHSFVSQNQEGLLHRAWRLWNEQVMLELVDPLLGDKFSEEIVILCVRIALLCVQEDAIKRPEMSTIVRALSDPSVTLPSPNAPHFLSISDGTDTTSPRDKIQQRIIDDNNVVCTGTISITELCGR